MSPTASLVEFELLQRVRSAQQVIRQVRQSDESELHLQKQLRREFPDDVVRAVFSLEELRQKAAKKFTRAARMWFDRKGLQQATAEAVARYKSQRFRGRVWDYCSGIGGDAIALAAQCEVLAVDSDPAACLRSAWNAEAYDVSDRVQPICADVQQLADRSGWVHLDPDRRAGGGERSVRLEKIVPGLPFIKTVMREFAGGAVKLSPAANFVGRFPEAEIELISLAGECKEATVWFGEPAVAGLWRATVLPEGVTLAGDPLEHPPEIGPLGEYLHDPDPAVVRAGLVDLLCAQLGLQRLDAEEEYLTSSAPVDSALVRSFRVIAELPNNDRQIRTFFRESEFGRVEVKCRRIPIRAEDVLRKLPTPGAEPGVLIYARIAGKSRAVVCTRVPSREA